MTTDTFHRMLMARCFGCGKEKGCDTYLTRPYCESCWPRRKLAGGRKKEKAKR